MTTSHIITEFTKPSYFHLSSNDADKFMIPLLQECRAKYPSLALYLRGDSGFASPDLYKACEDNDCNFVITTMESEPLIFYTIYTYIFVNI